MNARILIYNGNDNDNITLISVDINKFLLATKYYKLTDQIKECFKNKYIIKNLRKAKTIIEWQIMPNLDVSILKIDYSAFIYNLLKEKNLTNYKFKNILINARNFIEIF